ncbi:cytochrome P450 [Mycolicibacterium chitae]|uniref:Steroid C26-monooxygenase n=1 Tax=Mycolicibacterium chitae TaxID=1792 RepID=A0A3S4T462_MYCCI|nr:cytochrome P450 [Mycolicibacterium chitae]BBZ01614.1 cytochrome P450 [Mycolicibacterium chitae]VEG50450.1 cytochrome P450 [Mycolicibacterium chitae]
MSTDQLTPTGHVYYDPYDLDINRDPYPTFRRLRDEAPLYYNERHDFYAVSRYDDVAKGLADRNTFKSGRGNILELIKSGIEMPPGLVIYEDAPTHAIHRKLVSKMFTPKTVASLEPKIRAFTAACLDPLVGSARFDIISEFAAQMPMRVIGMLLGIPEEDQEHIRDRSDANLRVKPGKAMKFKENSLVRGGVFAEYLDWRVDNPSDDIMSELLHLEFVDETGTQRRLTRDEILAYVQVVAGAGNETTTRLIGWTAKVLAEHPDQRRELVADPSLIPNAVEELLRYEPPAPHIGRYVAADAEFHGQTVPAGSAILFVAGGANRDERVYDDPDRFDIHRRIPSLLTFGLGAHFCLGAALTRLEGRIALEEMLIRFPAWEVDLDAAEMSPTSTVRGWDTLPLVVT